MSDLKELVCSKCGVAGAEGRGGPVHVDSLPEGVDEHDVYLLIERSEYLFGEAQAAAENPSPDVTWRRIADALERIADRLDRL